jgi:dihydrodipicolinate synthase/N-acetylneuraminate lyase
MKYKNIHGVIPILPTPFTEQGEVDEVSFRNVIDAAIADGVDGLAMFGLASEFLKLSDAEKVRLAQILLEHTAKRVPVIISITHHSLDIARYEAAEAMRLGADALMVMPPFFMAPPASAVQNHIATLAADTEAPIIVQYAPIQTGSSLTAESFAELHEKYSNISYIKVDLTPAGPMIHQLESLTNGGLKSLVGYMGLHLPQDVKSGAVGVMPTVSVSRIFVQLFQLLQTRPEEGRKLHVRLLPLLSFMMQSVEMLVAVEKTILKRAGLLTSAYCRSPRWTLDVSNLAELDRLCSTSKGLVPFPIANEKGVV